MAKDKNGKNIKVPLDLKYQDWRKWIDTKYKENTFEALTKNEKQAIMKYKSSESYKINEKLYNNYKLNNKEMEFVRNLDKALNKMPDYEGDLVRDLYFFDKNSMKDFLNAHEVGNTVNYKAYTSTTKASSYNDMTNVRIYINNSKMGKDISSIGLDEEEVLYPRNTEFIVNSIRKSPNLVEIILKELSNE
ncbi:ADP-ribosyltransferase [uncultured Anaerococcus sp.]|uniref:ADP-ribosyltransferase n=1 Tax=uncultured Anaerococcus sp. TaxID=293428 RepID=UPI00288C2C3F|nr:ADP-ribosyltransferase [uncultured Anaerococcus sp.]